MSSWQLGLHRPHLQLWRRWLIQWMTFVAVLVVLGWGHGPRLDEVVWVLIVPPLVVVAGWGLISLALIGVWSLRNPDRAGLAGVDHPRRRRLAAPLSRSLWRRIPR